MVNALIHDEPVMFVVGVIALATGLALVLSHNLWSGGPAPVIVTLVGWTALIKGLLFLGFSPQGEVRFLEGLRYEQLFYMYMSITLAIGVWLTWEGFRPQPR